jgi:5'-3' exonuclease
MFSCETNRAELTRGMNVLDPVRLKKDLGLSLSQFVDLCLLCGTDFTPRIPL